ncbi:MBG domain-containing protein [Niveispirillum irakense]|uniref:MBG domain-containing protein n=1 Tax=Niveispirillum irakense TaxID=34011 RepID=UPI00040E37D6|nr:MBG domain-containing protein [Niveispirillum irakense]
MTARRRHRWVRAAALASVFCLPVLPALAGPEGGSVTSGQAAISQTAPGQTLIRQGSDRALIDWRSFSIGAGESVTVQQPGSQSLLVNRVGPGGTGTRIDGSLTANGQVVVIDRAGIVIGQGARIDAGSFLATTATLSDADFAAGRLVFSGAAAGAAILNEGHISVADGGYVALAAASVENRGLVEARLGRVVLAGTDSFTLDLHGDGLLRFELPAELAASVANSGTIRAQGGSVLVTARAAAGAVASINMGGLVEARGVEQRDGRIFIGGEGAAVAVTGTLDAGADAGRGGTIALSGDSVTLTGATVAASGATGGGSVQVGGVAGTADELAPTRTVQIDAQSQIRADATASGSGGTVSIRSDGQTSVAGVVSAKGGAGGFGGTATIIGKGGLDIAGMIDLSAPSGLAGTLLLEAPSIVIGNGGGSLAAASLQALLNSGTSVVMTATQDISLAADITKSTGGAASLILRAGRDITLAQGVDITSTSNALTIDLRAGFPIGGSLYGAGGRVVLAGANRLWTQGGAVRLTGSATAGANAISAEAADIRTGGGAIDLLATTPNPATWIGSINLTGAGTYQAGGGNITITADYIDLASNQFSTTGRVWLSQGSSNRTLRVDASGTDDNAALSLAVADFGNISAGTLRLGAATGGNLLIAATLAPANAGLLELMAGNGGQVTQAAGASAITASKLALLGAGGTFTLNNSGNQIGTLAADTGAISLTNQGVLTIGTVGTVSGVRFSDAASFTTGVAEGGLGVDIQSTIAYTGGGWGNAWLTISTAGDIRLASGGHISGPNVALNGGTVTLAAGSTISGGSSLIVNTGTLTLAGTISTSSLEIADREGRGLTLGAKVGDRLSLDAAEIGRISAFSTYFRTSGALRLEGGLDLSRFYTTTMRGGSVTVAPAAAIKAPLWLTLQTDILDLSGTVETQSSGRITLSTLGNGRGITLGGADDGQLHLGTAELANILGAGVLYFEASGAITVKEGLNLATKGAVYLNSGGNIAISGPIMAGNELGLAAAGTISIDAAGALTAAQTISLTADQMQIDGAIRTTGSVTLSTRTAGRAVELAGPGVDSGRLNLSAAELCRIETPTLAIYGGGAIAIAGTLVREGALALTAGGAVTQTGALQTGSLTINSGGSITLDHAGNRVGTISLATGSLGDIIWRDEGGIHIGSGGISAGRSVTLQAGQAGITQTGAIYASNLVLAGGSITLTHQGNMIGTLTAVAGANLDIHSNRALTVTGTGISAAGKVKVTANGNIILNAGVAAGGQGDALVLAANGTFSNLAGSNALSVGEGARFLVFASSPVGGNTGGVAAKPLYNRAFNFATHDGGTINNQGSRFVYAYAPVLTITPEGGIRTYDGTVPSLGYQVSGLLAGDLLADAVTGAATVSGAGRNVGGYVLSADIASLSSDLGYRFSAGSGFLTINPKALTYAIGAGTGTYGAVTPGSVQLDGVVEGDRVGGEVGVRIGGVVSSLSPSTNVGTYGQALIRLTGEGAGNYTIAASGNSAGQLIITPKTLTYSIASATGTYGTAARLGQVTLSGLVNGDDVQATAGVVGATVNDRLAAGTYSQSVSGLTGSRASNYTLAATGNSAGSLVIAPKTLTYSIGHAGSVYGTLATLGDIRLNGVLEGDAVAGMAALSNGALLTERLAAGTYGVSVSGLTGAAAGNYTIAVAGNSAGSLTVAPKPITYAIAGASATYGQTPVLGAATFNGVLAGDQVGGMVALAPGTSSGRLNVGTYGQTLAGLSGADANNYVLASSGHQAGTLTITPAALTITANGQTRLYGDADPALSYRVDGLVAGDSVTGALTRTAGENAGTYAITQGSLAASSNYTIRFTGADLVITPAMLSVTAVGGTKVYGDADPSLGYSVSGLRRGDAAGDVLSGGLGRQAGENVGRYGITQGSLVANGNYTVSFTGADLVITPAVLSVTVAGASKVYGDADPSLGYSVSGLRRGDAAGDVLSGGLSRLAGENAGTYAIGQGSLAANGNYTVSFTGADLVITPAMLSVTVAGGSKVYGDADPSLGYSVSGLRRGDAAGDVLSGGLGREAGENVGRYAITQGSLAANGNYTVSFTGADLVITPAMLSVTVAGASKVYGDADPSLGYSVSGLRRGDVAGDVLSGGLERQAGENAGTYAIGQGSLAANGNYTVSFTGADLVITPAMLSVTATGVTRTYGGVDPALAYGVSGLKRGDGAANVLTGALARAGGDNAGTYVIVQGSLALTSANYSLQFQEASFTITPAALTVTVENATRASGAANPPFSARFDGLVNGDDATSLSGLSFSTTATASSPAGSYAVQAGGISNGNYRITYIDGTLLVTGGAVLPGGLAELVPVTQLTTPPATSAPVIAPSLSSGGMGVASPAAATGGASVTSPAPTGGGLAGSSGTISSDNAVAAAAQVVQSASGGAADDDSQTEEMIPGLLGQQRRLPGEGPEGTPGLEQQFPNLGRVW